MEVVVDLNMTNSMRPLSHMLPLRAIRITINMSPLITIKSGAQIGHWKSTGKIGY